jgi:hypothetical protein
MLLQTDKRRNAFEAAAEAIFEDDFGGRIPLFMNDRPYGATSGPGLMEARDIGPRLIRIERRRAPVLHTSGHADPAALTDAIDRINPVRPCPSIQGPGRRVRLLGLHVRADVFGEDRPGTPRLPAVEEEHPAHGREDSCADRPLDGLARDHGAGGQVEPRAARLGELLPSGSAAPIERSTTTRRRGCVGGCAPSTRSAGAWSQRALYSNGDEFSINVKRPVAINGIVGVGTQADLLERMLTIELERRKEFVPDTVIRQEFEAARGSIVGGLLDLFARVLRRLQNEPPRAGRIGWLNSRRWAKPLPRKRARFQNGLC